mgnify:FL=1
MNGKQITSLALMGLAVLYDVSPVDIIPDIPVVGWIDDFIITASAGLNCIEKFTEESSKTLSVIAKTLKWGMIIIGTILILIVVLLAELIIKLFS